MVKKISQNTGITKSPNKKGPLKGPFLFVLKH